MVIKFSEIFFNNSVFFLEPPMTKVMGFLDPLTHDHKSALFSLLISHWISIFLIIEDRQILHFSDDDIGNT